jgi:hypothetical protein
MNTTNTSPWVSPTHPLSPSQFLDTGSHSPWPSQDAMAPCSRGHLALLGPWEPAARDSAGWGPGQGCTCVFLSSQELASFCPSCPQPRPVPHQPPSCSGLFLIHSSFADHIGQRHPESKGPQAVPSSPCNKVPSLATGKGSPLDIPYEARGAGWDLAPGSPSIIGLEVGRWGSVVQALGSGISPSSRA